MIARAAKIPVWIFQGDADEIVSVERARQWVAALRNAGGSPKYTEVPDWGHNVWEKASAGSALFEGCSRGNPENLDPEDLRIVQTGKYEPISLMAAAASAAATPAFSTGGRRRRTGRGLAAIRGGCKYGELDRALGALAFRAGDFLRLAHHDALVALAALIANVFVNRHFRLPGTIVTNEGALCERL